MKRSRVAVVHGLHVQENAVVEIDTVTPIALVMLDPFAADVVFCIHASGKSVRLVTNESRSIAEKHFSAAPTLVAIHTRLGVNLIQ